MILLRLNIAARRLGIHPETLKRYLRGGVIGGVKTPGGHWRVPEQEIHQRLRKTATNRNTIH